MIKNFFCFLYGIHVFTSMLFSCKFDNDTEIDLIKNVLHEKMYEDYDSFVEIKDKTIGKMLKQLLDSHYGFSLFQKLSDLSNDHTCIIKIGGPLGRIAGLQKRVQKEGQKNVWTLNCSFDSMKRIIAVKKMQDVFEFYKIEVPPYIILAHELLHYLFRLENYENGIKADKFVDQAFLKTLKGKITCPNTILLFGDIEGADPKAYDELVAIVGHRYNINGNFVFLGESLFLQEYLGTKNCFLSYGHASNIKDELLTLENIHEIINLEEVAGEIAIEDAAQDDIVKICIEEQYEFIKTVGIVENKLDDEGKSKSLPDDNITPLRIGTPSHLLKNQNIIDAELSEAGYHIQNVPGDGNCAFTSVEVARGNEAFTGDNQLVRKLSQQQKEQIPALRNATAELMSKNQNDTISIKVINNLRQLGFWDSGIEGGVGIEVLSFVAQVIRQPILVLTQEPDGH